MNDPKYFCRTSHSTTKVYLLHEGFIICLSLIMVLVLFWTKTMHWVLIFELLKYLFWLFVNYTFLLINLPTFSLVVHFLVNKFNLKNSTLNYIFKNRLLIQFYLNHMDKKHWKQFTGFYVTIQNGSKKLWVSQSEVWILWLKNLQTWVEMMDLNFYHGKMTFSGKLLSFSFE